MTAFSMPAWVLVVAFVALFIIGQQGSKKLSKMLSSYYRNAGRKKLMNMAVEINGRIDEAEVLEIYRANKWSSAERPDKLLPALRNSHTLVTARTEEGQLIGLANAISDGHLVVYYPHILVHPDRQGQGVGRKMVEAMQSIYGDFHLQTLTADGESTEFYRALGFERAGKTEPMWIYAGNDH